MVEVRAAKREVSGAGRDTNPFDAALVACSNDRGQPGQSKPFSKCAEQGIPWVQLPPFLPANPPKTLAKVPGHRVNAVPSNPKLDPSFPQHISVHIDVVESLNKLWCRASDARAANIRQRQSRLGAHHAQLKRTVAIVVQVHTGGIGEGPCSLIVSEQILNLRE